MSDRIEILFTPTGNPISPNVVSHIIGTFQYNEAVIKIVHDSKEMDGKGKVFSRSATLILSNFGMTRSGRFLGEENQK